MQTYEDFIRGKTQYGSESGFEPLWMPDFLFPFQTYLADWCIRKGRGATLADCGMGKSILQLVWSENVVRKTNKRVLILTPLAVAEQTIREGAKFGVEAARSRDGKLPSSKIVVTNYQQLHHFDPNDFVACAGDESSCLKDESSKTKAMVAEFTRTLPYRSLYTATAAPNDFVELGTSAEVLGELGFQDMITRFFKKETSKDHLGWGRTKFRMKGHAENDFWRWVSSWSRACRKPSDLGFSDDGYVLPPLVTNEHIVSQHAKREGFMFDIPAVTLQDQREERRRTLYERCELAASLIRETGKPAVAWCHLNDEGDELERMIPGAVQISGKNSDEEKEEALAAFASGQIRVLVSKSELTGYGLNWQHCAHETFFPSHSYERMYQSIRRCWRFGQKEKVTVDVITSPGEINVLKNMKRKSDQAEMMFSRLVGLINDQLSIERSVEYGKMEEVPSWLSSIK